MWKRPLTKKVRDPHCERNCTIQMAGDPVTTYCVNFIHKFVTSHKHAPIPCNDSFRKKGVHCQLPVLNFSEQLATT